MISVILTIASGQFSPIFSFFTNLTRNHKNKFGTVIKKRQKEIIKKCSILNRLSENKECSIVNHSNIELNILNNRIKKCPITGIALSLENDKANYIRTTTIWYLKQYKKDTYLMLCSTLLSNTRVNSPKYESSIITHLAKQIRNRFYNSSKGVKKSKKRTIKNYNQLQIEYPPPPK